MEEIEYQANYSEVEGRILIKDTESGQVEALEVQDRAVLLQARHGLEVGAEPSIPW